MTTDPGSETRLALPQVTLCAVTSVNVAATLRALETSLQQIDFAACKLLTDASVLPRHPQIEIVPIRRIGSSAAYSDFLLAEHVETSHCLVAQWDGHVLDAGRWRPQFLDYDYIGASWPQFGDGHDVGNGGFSLRSRRLMEACRMPQFTPLHPEDVAIGRANRGWLEQQGLRFAPRDLADIFAAERAGDVGTAFGYHGVFNMPRAIGVDRFWAVYRELDSLGTIRPDFGSLLWAVGRRRHGVRRALRMIADRARLARRT
ncbi:DUF5672 family protein [Novosphingobium resinovorum]|uniref:DUF5672 family protein n=1 Tax=Novosphingobium resinovorum TaxID=158500 RepID=UPI002ED5F847|nr:DUF5672 family protein [Novosphingobium resinovorum]